MELNTDILQLLEQIPQPAFLVKENQILHINHGAQQRQLSIGAPVAPLIAIGASEYARFTTGRLFLTLTVGQTSYNASVIKLQELDLFCLESEYQDVSLRALALAAQNLRAPLSTAMLNMDGLLAEQSGLSPAQQTQFLQLNKSLYEMQRLVGNMSDAAAYHAQPNPKAELRDGVSFIAEVVEKAAALIEGTGTHIQLQGANTPAPCLLDTDKLERGILNLISNAVKFSPKGSTVQVCLRQSLTTLYCSVQNHISQTQGALQEDLFFRYLREPGLEPVQNGIGLGLSIVRSAAIAHNGTLLIDKPEVDTLRFTLSITKGGKFTGTLRCPVQIPVNYTGGYDRTRIELAEILPPEAFQ